MRFNKAKCKVWHLGHCNPHYQYKLGDVRIEHSPADKNLGYWWMAAGHEPVCPHNPESLAYPGLDLMQCQQGVEMILCLCSAL